ncbi:hypothetical protein BD324DRAFT_589334 [Kockovaella imperatae]|uniref:FRG1-like family-domain-containing protein n=1 Tax=Kockovaella imperatae TaxID=4999 RepID=A0A1Y1UHS6_9TREE|nr:hypothetical protein BD324DRAFT_589334 [Kockovaella imperatae]ORX37572.1 hypothetical protein BD324DRAFT_589334 [Kockovaella imperatae]
MSSSGVVSKKLKFKGDKPKKKKRHHREVEDEDGDVEFQAMASADPKGWIFPSEPVEVSGPAFILLPTEPLTCLAYDPQRQRVIAAPVEIPEAPEGMDDLSPSEVLAVVEPSDINHVWVASRLSGSEEVISLRTTAGTFLTASPSGVLTAVVASRGPLEAFKPMPVSSSSPFPSFSLWTSSEKYISVTPGPSLGGKIELRADSESVGERESFRIKCQREFVLKAKMGTEGEKGKRRMGTIGGGGGAAAVGGSVEDEIKRNKQAQTWGAGRVVVSDQDRSELKRAKKEGRLAEAMLDRRAALKSDRYAK